MEATASKTSEQISPHKTALAKAVHAKRDFAVYYMIADCTPTEAVAKLDELIVASAKEHQWERIAPGDTGYFEYWAIGCEQAFPVATRRVEMLFNVLRDLGSMSGRTKDDALNYMLVRLIKWILEVKDNNQRNECLIDLVELDIHQFIYLKKVCAKEFTYIDPKIAGNFILYLNKKRRSFTDHTVGKAIVQYFVKVILLRDGIWSDMLISWMSVIIPITEYDNYPRRSANHSVPSGIVVNDLASEVEDTLHFVTMFEELPAEFRKLNLPIAAGTPVALVRKRSIELWPLLVGNQHNPAMQSESVTEFSLKFEKLYEQVKGYLMCWCSQSKCRYIRATLTAIFEYRKDPSDPASPLVERQFKREIKIPEDVTRPELS